MRTAREIAEEAWANRGPHSSVILDAIRIAQCEALEEAAQAAEQARLRSYDPHDHPSRIANIIRALKPAPEAR